MRKMESLRTEGIRYETKSKYSLRLVMLVEVVGGCFAAAAAASENQRRVYIVCVRKKYNSKTILRSEKKIEAFY